MKNLLEKIAHLKRELCGDTVIKTGDIIFESRHWNETQYSDNFRITIQLCISTAIYKQEKTIRCSNDTQPRSHCEYPLGQTNETALHIRPAFIQNEINE